MAELGLPPVVDDGDPSTWVLMFPDGCSTTLVPDQPAAVVLDDLRAAARTGGWVPTGEQGSDRVQINDERRTVVVETRPDDEVLLQLVVRPRGR